MPEKREPLTKTRDKGTIKLMFVTRHTNQLRRKWNRQRKQTHTYTNKQQKETKVDTCIRIVYYTNKDTNKHKPLLDFLSCSLLLFSGFVIFSGNVFTTVLPWLLCIQLMFTRLLCPWFLVFHFDFLYLQTVPWPSCFVSGVNATLLQESATQRDTENELTILVQIN